MPSSRADHIPFVLDIVEALNPLSILDIGIGFGKWGYLFREYLDIVPAERQPDRYASKGWQVRIDGIEGFPQYISDIQRAVYSNIYLEQVEALVPRLDQYDVIFMGDVIEHFELDVGRELIKSLLPKSNMAFIATTPSKWVAQDSLIGNNLEIHKSFWPREQFESIGRCRVVDVRNDIRVAIYTHNDYHRRLKKRILIEGLVAKLDIVVTKCVDRAITVKNFFK